MKDRLKRIWNWEPGMGVVAAAAVCLLLLLLVPLLRLALYAVPWYDDYNYGQFVKNFVDMERSIGSAVSGAVYCMKTQWYAWQGTFSSVFFMSLMPGVWGEQYYFWGPVFLILILTFSVWTLTGILAGKVLKSDRSNRIVLQAVSTAIVVEMIYSAQQGFYWYNGGIHYVGMHSFLLLLIAAWVCLMTDCGRILWVFLVTVSMIGAVLAGGANYVTALQGLLVGFSIMAVGIFRHRKRTLLLIPSLLVYGFSFYLSATAPGNNVRSETLHNYGGDKMDPILAVLCSFKEAALQLEEFTGPLLLIMLALALPFVRNVVRRTRLRFPYPGVLSAWSVCLYAAGFTPSLYVLGHGGFDRTLNAVKITYQILVMVNFVYWIGWLYRKQRETNRGSWFAPLWKRVKGAVGIGQEKSALRFYLLAGLLVLAAFALEKNQAGNYSSYGAYYYIHTGEAYAFHQEYLDRVETIKNGGSSVAVNAYYFRPWFLRIGDLSDDPGREENQAMARWYNKEAVYSGG